MQVYTTVEGTRAGTVCETNFFCVLFKAIQLGQVLLKERTGTRKCALVWTQDAAYLFIPTLVSTARPSESESATFPMGTSHNFARDHKRNTCLQIITNLLEKRAALVHVQSTVHQKWYVLYLALISLSLI